MALGKTLHSHSASSLHLGVKMGIGKFTVRIGVTLQWTFISYKGSRSSSSRLTFPPIMIRRFYMVLNKHFLGRSIMIHLC